jgi:two-component system response regulator QseB
LLVEDDPGLGSGLSKSLSKKYAVDWVQDGETACHAIFEGNYDLVILDLGLPKVDGLEVLRRTRSKNESSTLILTARDTTEQKVKGLDLGADDYLVKPFELDELFARVRALLRRKGINQKKTLQSGDLILNIETRQVSYKNEPISLTPREFQILHSLMSRPGVVLSIAQLRQQLHGWYDEINSNAVEVHLHNLRKKIPKSLIENVRGMGYKFTLETDQS